MYDLWWIYDGSMSVSLARRGPKFVEVIHDYMDYMDYMDQCRHML